VIIGEVAPVRGSSVRPPYVPSNYRSARTRIDYDGKTRTVWHSPDASSLDIRDAAREYVPYGDKPDLPVSASSTPVLSPVEPLPLPTPKVPKRVSSTSYKLRQALLGN
jgi:hypothetical protein